MKPYYERGGITIYHGDARLVLPELAKLGHRFGAIITDPVWPGATVPLVGSDRPIELFAEVAALVPALSDRLVVQIGRDTDPRFLTGVPACMPYLCTSWLRYDVPGYKGRILLAADIALAWGPAPPPRPRGHVIPGEASGNAARAFKRVAGHPCPRRLDHVRWLVHWFSAGGAVLDPFLGSGTTLVASQEYGVSATGVEIEERFCEVAAKRLDQGQMFAEPASVPAPEQETLFP